MVYLSFADLWRQYLEERAGLHLLRSKGQCVRVFRSFILIPFEFPFFFYLSVIKGEDWESRVYSLSNSIRVRPVMSSVGSARLELCVSSSGVFGSV